MVSRIAIDNLYFEFRNNIEVKCQLFILYYYLLYYDCDLSEIPLTAKRRVNKIFLSTYD